MFDKRPFTISEQINQLQERGLTINNIEVARRTLSNISYYRLGEYWHVMETDKEKHLFKKGSLFSEVLLLYNFDTELKILLFSVIEKIEISLRTKLIYHLCHEFDPWWFQNHVLFKDALAWAETLEKLKEEVRRKKKNDITLKKHYKKYKTDLRFPPAWKTLEFTSFGTLSRIYGNLNNTIKSKDIIANELGAINHTYLPSWLQSISHIRNHCAHHSRLWNRNLSGAVKLLTKPPLPWIRNQENIPRNQSQLYIHLCIMKYMLNIIAPQNTFGPDLKNLLFKYSTIDPNALGLKPNWDNEPLWL